MPKTLPQIKTKLTSPGWGPVSDYITPAAPGIFQQCCSQPPGKWLNQGKWNHRTGETAKVSNESISCLRKLYLARRNLLYQLLISHHFFLFSWGQRDCKKSSQTSNWYWRMSRSSKLKKKKEKRKQMLMQTCFCYVFTIPYLERERERYTHNLLCLGNAKMLLLGPG